MIRSGLVRFIDRRSRTWSIVGEDRQDAETDDYGRPIPAEPEAQAFEGCDIQALYSRAKLDDVGLLATGSKILLVVKGGLSFDASELRINRKVTDPDGVEWEIVATGDISDKVLPDRQAARDILQLTINRVGLQ